ALYGLSPSTLTPLNATLQVEYTRIIRQSLTRSFEFCESALIVEISAIKILSACPVCFPCPGRKPKRRIDRCLSQCQARRGMVNAQKREAIMGVSELTVCLEKRRVAGDGLVQ